MVVASVSHMLTLRSEVMLFAKVSFLSVLSQVIVNLKSLNSGFLFYCKYHSFFVCLFCFFCRWHLKIQRYKEYISSLTANRLVCILCPVLRLNVSPRKVTGKLTVDCLCRCVVVNVSSATVKRPTKNVLLVFHHCCKTSWIAMWRVLPPTLEPVVRLQGGETCNIAIQLVLLQCCKTSCTFFVARLL